MSVETPTRSKYVFHNTTETESGWLSPSSITEFLRCGACFELARIRRVPRPLSINLPIGSAVHKALETARLRAEYLPSGLITPQSLEEAVEAGAEHFQSECEAPTDEETGEPIDAEIDLGSKFTSLGQAKDTATTLAKFAVPEILKLDRKRGKVASVEYNLSMLGVSPYPFAIQGRMDCLYVDFLTDASKPELATISADLKTSSKQEAPDEFTAIAQTIYVEHWLCRGLPHVALVDVADKRVHPEVKTYPLALDEYSAKLTHDTVLGVAEDISAGRFRPHPNWACDYIHGFGEFQVAVSGFPE